MEPTPLVEYDPWFGLKAASAQISPDAWWSRLTEADLLSLFSFLGEGIRCNSKCKGKPRLEHLRLSAANSLVSRNITDWPESVYDLDVLEEKSDLSFEGLSDEDLGLLYGCAAEVMDFSCLAGEPGRSIRWAVCRMYARTETELVRRGLKPVFLDPFQG